MSVGPFQIAIIALVVLLMFGRGRIGATLGDLGRGVKAFRTGLAEGGAPAAPLALESPDAAAGAQAAPSAQSAADK